MEVSAGDQNTLHYLVFLRQQLLNIDSNCVNINLNENHKKWQPRLEVDPQC